MICDLLPGTKIVDAQGQVLSVLTQAEGEAFTLAQVTLPDSPPQPAGPQPRAQASWLAYFFSDIFLPTIVIATYRQGLRRAWGRQMAPLSPSSRYWLSLLGLGAFGGFVLGWVLGKIRK